MTSMREWADSLRNPTSESAKALERLEERRAIGSATTEAMLQERKTKYGLFPEHACITQSLKRVMRDTPRWNILEYDQREALEMIAHKIGRILNGDPNYADSWADIAGYARLVEKRLNGEPI